ncbi:MAG: hypothetical protein ACOYK9_01930 [Chlamydiia bacterium]
MEFAATCKTEHTVKSAAPLKLPPLQANLSHEEKSKPLERRLVKPPAILLNDLCDWYQKRFKTPIMTPLADKRALDAKVRFLDGTVEAPIVLLFPKKIEKGHALYKNIQLAIHHYLAHCTLLPPDQFSKELATKTKLVLTDFDWIKPYHSLIQKDPANGHDTLFNVPIFYFESLEILQTPEGKQRLWKALLSLPRS